MSALAEKTINAVLIYNPLDPTKRVQDTIVWAPGKTVAEYIDGLPETNDWVITVNGVPVKEENYALQTMEPDDFLFMAPIPRGGGGGGGGGKQIIRLVAMIAIMVVAMYIAPTALTAMGGAEFAAGSMTIGATSISYTSIFAGAVSMVGSMAMNMLTPGPKANPMGNISGGGMTDYKDSPTYGIDGPKNTSRENLPVPVVYGEFRVGGNRGQIVSHNDGESQFVRLQQIISEGPIESITEVELEQQPAENYQDVNIEVRLGVDDQEIVPWFDDTTTLYSQSNISVTQDWSSYITSGEIDKFRVDFLAGSGLVNIDAVSGARRTVSVPLEIRYRPYGSGDDDWVMMLDSEAWSALSGSTTGEQATGLRFGIRASTWTTVQAVYEEQIVFDDGDGRVIREMVQVVPPSGGYTVSGQYRAVGDEDWITVGSQSGTWSGSSTVVINYEVLDLPMGAYEVRGNPGTVASLSQLGGEALYMSGAQRTPLRKSFESLQLEEGKYEIAYRRTSENSDSDYIADDIFCTDIGEIILEDVRYNHTATLNVEVRFSEQLNKLPNVTGLVRGRLINTYDLHGNIVDEEVWSCNPAWIAIDLLTNTRYGGKIAIGRIDMPRFVEWAEWCEEEGLEFHGVFDFNTNLWQAIQTVGGAGHAAIIPVGTKYSLTVDKPDVAEMMFGVGNIKAGTFETEWLPKEDRSNEIEITYFDKDDGYKQKTLRVTDFDALATGAESKVLAYTQLGIRDVIRANAEAYYQLYKNRYLLKTVRFEAPLDAISVRHGGIVYVQHDMPVWEFSGRLASGSTSSVLKLDRPVTMEDGQSYKAMVHQSAEKVFDVTIEDIQDETVYVSGVDDVDLMVKRFVTEEGTDVEIYKVSEGETYTEIVLSGIPDDLEIGQTAELWNTDVIREANVEFEAGTSITEVTLSTPFDFTPATYANFMFGPVDRVKRPFRLYGYGIADKTSRALRLLEYDERVYAPPETVPGEVGEIENTLELSHVELEQKYERLIRVSSSVITRLTIAWKFPATGLYDGAEVFISTDEGPYMSRGIVRGRGRQLTLDVDDGASLAIKIIPFDGLGSRPNFETATIYYHNVAGKIPAPATPENFVVRKTSGGIEFVWDPVNEVDLLGYEIREGASWDAGTTLISRFAGTRWQQTRTEGGTYTFHLKAMDVNETYSDAQATYVFTLPEPAAVRNFVAVQNGGMIVLDWDANAESDMSHYEIREGISWSASKFIAAPRSTRHMVPADVGGSPRFWIRAIDRSHVESDEVFVIPLIAPYDTRNVVVVEDEDADGYTGLKLNLSLDDDDNLRLDDDAQAGEYIFEVALGSSQFARSVIEADFDVVQSDQIAWEDATFTWASPNGQFSWLQQGDASFVTFEQQIAIGEELDVAIIESLPLNDTLNGEVAAIPNVDYTTPAYEDGRYRDGVHSFTGTNISWDITVPEEFNITYWARPVQVTTDIEFPRLVGDGVELTLYWDASANTFVLVDQDDDQIVVSVPALVEGDPILIGIVQTTMGRTLYIGIDDEVFSGTGAFLPVGAFEELHVR
jgi:predicted phage tail protein